MNNVTIIRFLPALLIAMPLVLLVLGFQTLDTRKGRRSVSALACVAGACVGGVLVWYFLPSDWSLPFWTTLEASVNAARYGHTVEHAAEGIVVLLLLATTLAGLVSCLAAVLGLRIAARLKHC